YFDGPDIEEKPIEKPVEDPLSPKLDVDEDTMVVEKRPLHKIMIWTAIIAIIAIMIWGYLRYFDPYVSDAQTTGYVIRVEKRGTIFKTYEGEMISEFAIQDTSKIYQRDFSFSFDNDSLAQDAMKLQGSGKKITLKYKKFSGVIPWRGASKCIITGIER
ncbi:MAG: hypothetical protein RR667_06700, partial [Muribaculaceae bacterium]